MSTSVPFWFAPVKYNNKLYVDGGCINNYPIEIFKDQLENVIGVCLFDEMEFNEVNNLESFFGNIFTCFAQGILRNVCRGFEQYTIKINLKDVSILDLNMDIDKKRKLLDIGYQEAMKYFKLTAI